MNRLELINTLDIVSRGLSNNTLVPIFSYFCFTGDTVFGWNDAIGVVGPCKVGKPFAVHGTTLLGLLKNCSGNEVELTLTKGHLKVVCDDSEFKLPYKGEDEFLWSEPKIEQGQDTIECQLGSISDGLKDCLKTCSIDVSLGNFNRIAWVNNIIYSTDGDAVTKATTLLKHVKEVNLTVARSIADCIVRLQDHMPGAFVYPRKEWVASIDPNGFKVFGRNLGEPELDYEQEIRNTVGLNNYKFVPIPDGLDAALSRARVVADAETKPTAIAVTSGVSRSLCLKTEGQNGAVVDSLPTQHNPISAVSISAETIQKCMEGCNEVCIAENCTIWQGENVLRLVANRGE